MLKLLKLSDLVSKSNVRNEHDDTIQELAASIMENGLLSPLTVSPLQNGKYEIIAGHRRYEALKIINEPFVECNVIEEPETETDKIRMQLAENIQRKNMSAYEYVEIFNQLIDEFKMTKKQIAKYCNKSESWVSDQYKAVKILDAKYGDARNIPEEEKKLSATTIRMKESKKRHPEVSVTITGNGFSCTKRRHTYMLYCDDFDFETKLNSFLEENGMKK